MRGKATDRHVKAQVLVEAVYLTDEEAAQRFGVSVRSLGRWRKELLTDRELADLVNTKKVALDAAWVKDLAVPIRKAMNFIGKACDSMDARQRSNPEMIHAVAGALKICAEVYLTSQALNVGNIAENSAAESLPEQVFGEPVASDFKQ